MWLLLLLGIGAPAPRGTTAGSPSSRPRAYRPGVHIQWSPPLVELDGQVVLREGYLEFFACCGETKAHESVVSVRAEPLAVYEALGLIGMTPGRPAHIDPKTGVEHPAYGDRVDLFVSWRDQNGEHAAPAHEWMLDLTTRKPASPGAWIFTGSLRYRDGTFGASEDGALVTTVGFPTAILSYLPQPLQIAAAATSRPAAEIASNASDEPHGGIYSNRPTDPQLAADPTRVPAVGTKVTLIIRPAAAAAAQAASPTSQPRAASQPALR